jgi:hypothetical protein
MDQVRDPRSCGILDDLVRDARYAVRRLARERGFSIPVVAALGIGIGVTAAVFALVNAVLIRPLPYRDADRLVALRHAARTELLGAAAAIGLRPGRRTRG